MAKLRKPTVAAWIVNTLALRDASIVDQLRDLGARLGAAQAALDADRLRELSTQRRRLVSDACARAFELAGRSQPPTALRDDVRATFDASVADPDVAARLGRLQHAEQWSGFGFAATGLPQLTLVRGGRDAPAGSPRPTQRETQDTAAQRRQHARIVKAAQDEFEQAEAEVESAQLAVETQTTRVRDLESTLRRIRDDLEDAKNQLGEMRLDLTRHKQRRQAARRALDRAETGRST